MSQQIQAPSMMVRGVVVPHKAIVAALRYMWGDDAFWRENVTEALEVFECPPEIASEAAGRLMQWAKRRGLIHRPFDDTWGATSSFAEAEFPYV